MLGVAAQEAETQLQHANGALDTHSKQRKFGFLRCTSRSAVVHEADSYHRAGEGTRHSLDLFDVERPDEAAGRVWITSWVASSAVDPAEAAAEAAQVAPLMASTLQRVVILVIQTVHV